ncbi:MAG TPA: hypothetical protein VMA54_20985 [Steroidobacteraceae bacterium]|nr:hypothetical protein [Steroidobacteraceae bacterium]
MIRPWASFAPYRKSFMTRTVVVIAVALMLAQWGAEHHAHSHDRFPAPGPNQHSHIKPCPQCPSFAPVVTVAGGAVPLAVIRPAPTRPSESSSPAALVELPITLAFRSRAPPMAT